MIEKLSLFLREHFLTKSEDRPAAFNDKDWRREFETAKKVGEDIIK
jgi:hypothetical protein